MITNLGGIPANFGDIFERLLRQATHSFLGRGSDFPHFLHATVSQETFAVGLYYVYIPGILESPPDFVIHLQYLMQKDKHFLLL